MIVLDQRHDAAGQELYRVHQQYGPPEFVKAASIEQLCGAEDLAAHLYALPGRLYPLHTPAAVWMSSAFFHEKRAALSPVNATQIERRLQEAGEFFGIGRELTQLRDKVAAATDADVAKLSDDCFAYVWTGENGSRERHWPLRNEMEVQAAADSLQQHRDTFLADDRRVIADRILTKAAELGAVLEPAATDFLERQAGLGCCTASAAATTLLLRARLLPERHADVADELKKMAAAIEQDPSVLRSGGLTDRLVSTLDRVDREYGLRQRYSQGLPRPEDVLYGITKTAAAEALDGCVEVMTGTVYKTAELAQIPLQEVRDRLGDSVADDLSGDGLFLDPEKLAEVLPIMPRDDAAVIDRLARQFGVPAVLQIKQAGLGRLLDDAALLELASAVA